MILQQIQGIVPPQKIASPSKLCSEQKLIASNGHSSIVIACSISLKIRIFDVYLVVLSDAYIALIGLNTRYLLLSTDTPLLPDFEYKAVAKLQTHVQYLLGVFSAVLYHSTAVRK